MSHVTPPVLSTPNELALSLPSLLLQLALIIIREVKSKVGGSVAVRPDPDAPDEVFPAPQISVFSQAIVHQKLRGLAPGKPIVVIDLLNQHFCRRQPHLRMAWAVSIQMKAMCDKPTTVCTHGNNTDARPLSTKDPPDVLVNSRADCAGCAGA